MRPPVPASAPACCTMCWASPRPTAPVSVAARSRPNSTGRLPGTPGYHMSTVGAEKGVTTGRSRRCGWFDAALLKRSAQVNGLSGPVHHQARCARRPERSSQLCTGYQLDGRLIDILPMGADDIARCEPIYETLPGWSQSTVGVTDYEEAARWPRALPAAHRRGHRRADPHGVDQPGPRPHDLAAPPLSWPRLQTNQAF